MEEKHMFQNKLILLVITGLLITSCSVTGKYQFIGYNTNIKFEIKKDSSFIRDIWLNFESDSLIGKWTITNDTLNTFIHYPPVYFGDTTARIEEHYKDDMDSLYFKVYLNEKDTLIFANVFLNNNHEVDAIINEKGNAVLKKKVVNSFTISFLEGCWVNHQIKNKDANYFIIYADSCSYPEHIIRINPTVNYIIKRNKLIPINSMDEAQETFALKKRLLGFK